MSRESYGSSDASSLDAERLRRLPSVEKLASSLDGLPRKLAVAAAREEVDALRSRIATGAGQEPTPDQLREAVSARAAQMRQSSFRRVINATGIVLHTNLGRAPLAEAAVEAVAEIARSYSNLEYDLERGERGRRAAHVEPLIREISGAEAAFAVNNNAAAVLLALAAFASGRDVIVSRGQLIEIGDSFRIPEIFEQSGARLVEVGTTNRTHPADYERAIGPDTAALLRVHQSNFRTVGFVHQVDLQALCRIGRDRGVLVIDDLGSGAVEQIGDEPTLRQSIAAGADLVCCSGDKLLGGPQAGVIAGSAEVIEQCRRHPLARALRLDKLQLAALEATLRLFRDEGPSSIPALAMLETRKSELARRASHMAELIGGAARVRRDAAPVGGGSLPAVKLEGPVCEVDPGGRGADGLAAALRRATPPVVARIANQRVLIDPRTMSDADAEEAAQAVRDAIA